MCDCSVDTGAIVTGEAYVATVARHRDDSIIGATFRSVVEKSDCRRHNNNNRLDTRAIQKWIDDTIKAHREK